MAIRKLKPDTPSRRYMSISTFDEITKKRPERSLTRPLKKTGGRNNLGRITSVSYTHLTLPTKRIV